MAEGGFFIFLDASTKKSHNVDQNNAKRLTRFKPDQWSKGEGMSKPKVVLAYSGGLDTSVICRWLAEQNYEVICFCANIGQAEDFGALEGKALNSGATKCIVTDLRHAFVNEFVFPAIAWNARYEGRYLLGTSLARPLIAKYLVETARAEGAQYIAHGATGKGNDQVRFELTAYALKPDVRIIAPWRDPKFRAELPGRQELIAYAAKYGIPVKATTGEPWSSDDNLMHISFEAGMLEDPAVRPLDRMSEKTRRLEDTAPERETVTIQFAHGVPVAVNGRSDSSAGLLAMANELGARHGIGRVDIVESRYVGMKSRGVYETPGATILMAAHQDLEGLTVGGDLLHTKATLAVRFAQMVYQGYWFTEEMLALRAFLDVSQQHVCGSVTLELYCGNVIVVGRESPRSLYDAAVASMEADGGAYDQSDATGFIRLHALPLRVAARRAAALHDAGCGQP